MSKPKNPKEPTPEDLSRNEEAFFDEVADDKTSIDLGAGEVIESGIVLDPPDVPVFDFFFYNWRGGCKFLEGDPSIAHVLLRQLDTQGKPVRLVEYWTPRQLMNSDRLSRLYEGPVGHASLFVDAGVSKGLVKAKESFFVELAGVKEQELLNLSDNETVLVVWREFYDADDEAVIIERRVLTRGQSMGMVRDIPVEKGASREW